MKAKVILTGCLFIIMYIVASATIINVPDDQPTIQEGINVAVDGDTVLVQPGTYVENIDYNGKNITVGSLFLTTGDSTYIDLTTIDGNQDGTVVTFESGENPTAVLCGFFVKNGYSIDGGGVYCEYSSPTLKNVIVRNNIAYGTETDGLGGGLYCDNSSISLFNVTIKNNLASSELPGGGGGGGIYFNNSSPILQNVKIIDNVAYYAGGINCVESSPNMENVIIKGNNAIWVAGINCMESSPSLKNVTIVDNVSILASGGIYCENNSSPSLINCILWNDSPIEICFGQYSELNSITVSYSNIQGGEEGIVTNNSGIVYWLEGNINEDPLFIGTGENPYSLLEGSPCIDAGILDTTGLNLPLWDIIGNLRIWDGNNNGSAIIDMGAYEYGAPPFSLDDTPEYQIGFNLYQNYPNPFNTSTTISFNLAIPIIGKQTRINIYNVKGQLVKQLSIINNKSSVKWDGEDENGNPVSSGLYFYQLKIEDEIIDTKKCLLLK